MGLVLVSKFGIVFCVDVGVVVYNVYFYFGV